LVGAVGEGSAVAGMEADPEVVESPARVAPHPAVVAGRPRSPGKYRSTVLSGHAAAI